VPDSSPGTPAAVSDEPPASVLQSFFGDRADVARAFAGHLAGTGVARGLLGPREVPRLWSRHILNCAAVAPLLPPGAHVVDVGSGAGLPGLVLALARPDVRVTLVEPLLRRVTWLEEVTGDLRLPSVSVLRARAEELHGLGADVATARAVATLDRLSAWCFPLLRSGGVLLAIKGRSAGEELAQGEKALRALGAVGWRVLEVGNDLLEEPTTVVEVRKGADGRRGGTFPPAKRRPRPQRSRPT
jgi:16S rRNA (guanine527-N7)-methyltransferase